MREFEEFLREATQLDLTTVDGLFRLGELADESWDALPDSTDQLELYAERLGVTRDLALDAWAVASAFPPATRRGGIPWTFYWSLHMHPDRHELIALAAERHWDEQRLDKELSDRFAAKWMNKATG
jgi:hypothetical protein